MDDLTEQLSGFVDQIVDIGEVRYTRRQVADLARVDFELANRIWRAAGFPEVDEDVVMFTDEDVRVLGGIRDLLNKNIATQEMVLEISRAIGQISSRLAAAEVSVLQQHVEAPVVTPDGINPESAQETMRIATGALPFLEDALIHLWRRHLSAHSKRALVSASADRPERCVGFVDITNFSSESKGLETAELEDLINRFESIAFDVVSGHGGRIVKLIGDEVMFTVEEPLMGARIAVDLVDALDREPSIPRVRAGLSYGAVVDIAGDVFGQNVNLASRLTEAAKPGTVVVSEPFKGALDETSGFETKRIRRIQTLRGIGKVRAFVLRVAGEGDPQDD